MGWNKRLALAFWKQVKGLPPAPLPVPPMSYSEFIAVLRTTPRTWRLLDKTGLIRTGDDDCPITEVYKYITGRKYSIVSWALAARALGLPDAIAAEIWPAADNRPGHDPQVRRDLLVATGLLVDPMDANLAALTAARHPEASEEMLEMAKEAVLV